MMDAKCWITAERWLSGVLWFIWPRVKTTNLQPPPSYPHPNRSLVPWLFVGKTIGGHQLLGPSLDTLAVSFLLSVVPVIFVVCDVCLFHIRNNRVHDRTADTRAICISAANDSWWPLHDGAYVSV